MMSEEVEVSAGSATVNENAESNVEDSGASATSPEDQSGGDVGIQLEPTKSEMERERLISRAEQLQDEIVRLHDELVEKEEELTDIKKQLGITPFTEFKQSMAHGWKVVGDKWKGVQETETYRKLDTTLSGWKNKVEGSGPYQKTVSSLNEGGKKVSGGISSAGTKIKESETLKNVGEKTSSALKRTGTAIRDTSTTVGTKISGAASSLKEKVWSTSVDHADDGTVPEAEGNTPTKGETVVPDEPSKE